MKTQPPASFNAISAAARSIRHWHAVMSFKTTPAEEMGLAVATAIALDIARMAKEADPEFDRTRFLEACGVDRKHI